MIAARHIVLLAATLMPSIYASNANNGRLASNHQVSLVAVWNSNNDCDHRCCNPYYYNKCYPLLVLYCNY